MIVGIIPARYASTRFPGKPLIDIDGKSMIRRVYEQASKAGSLSRLIVATDDERIAEHVHTFGAEYVMTDSELPSGTDRCWQALQRAEIKAEYVINIQGDEPFINPEQIEELAVACDGQAELVTQMIRIDRSEFLHDMGEVKIVLNDQHEALYFSRSPIPFLKGIPSNEWHLHHDYYRHVGMYAYRTDILAKICRLEPSALEKAESLEQLRWLENGYRIRLTETQYDSHCVDTPEDVEKVLKLMKA